MCIRDRFNTIGKPYDQYYEPVIEITDEETDAPGFLCRGGSFMGQKMCIRDRDKVRDLEFAVVSEAELPEELAKLVAEKKAAPFKLTYSNDQGLYIVVGYGEQATGGYSCLLYTSRCV